MNRDLPTPPLCAAASGHGSADDRVVLLAEVDFKWLMAGQGWWIDSGRLHADPAYCAGLVILALNSPCSALRDCASFLQIRAAHPAKRA